MGYGNSVFYSSENGDEWLLVCDGDLVLVRHQPNAASGRRAGDIDLGALGNRTPLRTGRSGNYSQALYQSNLPSAKGTS